MEKRKWSRPMLLVLTRGRGEEMVLVNCKGDMAGPALNDALSGCSIFDGGCAGPCNTIAAS